MEGSAIVTGNTRTGNGGAINGSDAASGERNTASGKGHSAHDGNQWRSATAGSTMKSDTFGFWLND